LNESLSRKGQDRGQVKPEAATGTASASAVGSHGRHSPAEVRIIFSVQVVASDKKWFRADAYCFFLSLFRAPNPRTRDAPLVRFLVHSEIA